MSSAPEFQISDKSPISRLLIGKVSPTVENSQTASDKDAASSFIHLSHSAWVAAATAANNDRFSFSNDDLIASSSVNQHGLQTLTNIVYGRRKGPRTDALTETNSDKISGSSTIAAGLVYGNSQQAGEESGAMAAFGDDSLVWDGQNPIIGENAISDEQSYCEPHSGLSSIYGGLCDHLGFESDQTRINDNTSNLQQRQNLELELQTADNAKPSNVATSTANVSTSQADVDHNRSNNAFEKDSPSIWIIQFHPLTQKSMMLRDICNFIQLLEALFEPPSLSVSAYAARYE